MKDYEHIDIKEKNRTSELSLHKDLHQYNGDLLNTENINSKNVLKLYIETYGCQMNFSDSEIVASLLQPVGFTVTKYIKEADVIFINTCSIREKAEETIRNRLTQLHTIKKNNPNTIIGILGCMAERLKTKLLTEEKIIDIIAGPDAYRSLPLLIDQAKQGDKAVNTFLSREETYTNITPIRLDSNGVTAFISIMRGCNNMCSFCVVPYTRGRERSRNPNSIVDEIKTLSDAGYHEVTLLGQNVDSFLWKDAHGSVNFAELLDKVAKSYPHIRIRFATSHPKDITDQVLHTMAQYNNICKYIHLPVQSGNSRILNLMNRGYTLDWYLKKIDRIRSLLGEDCGLSSDFITGFCTETEAEHRDTLRLINTVQFDYAYTFMYSERPGTPAARKLNDDIPLEVKKKRVQEIISTQQTISLKKNQKEIGKTYEILVEGHSKRSMSYLQGRNSQNKVVIFPKTTEHPGDRVHITIDSCTSATLIGKQ